MTAPEYAALRELQAAEAAAQEALQRLEKTRERYWEITRREIGRERVKARASYLRVVPAVAEE
jgi:predicted ATPase